VVVESIEYIVLGKANVFYVTLAAPETDFANAQAQLNQILQTVNVQ
jgi:hypothetical protein